MSGNDWNRLGRDVKDIVQNAIDTGNFGALNRDLGVTLENALGNMARSLKNPGSNGSAGTYSSSSERMQRAREKFALFVNTRKMKAGSITALAVGLALAISCGFALGIVGVTALFLDSIVKPFAITASVLLPDGCGSSNLGESDPEKSSQIPLLCEDFKRKALRKHQGSGEEREKVREVCDQRY